MRGFTHFSNYYKDEHLEMLAPFYTDSKVKLNTPARTLTPCSHDLNLFGNAGSRVRTAGGVGDRETTQLRGAVGRLCG